MADSKFDPKNKRLEANNTSKFNPNFMYKVLIVTIFLILIPIFPSQAPDFINQTLLNRSWELLHLIFVGIAVSYGLFSRRNDEESEKEINQNPNSKFDNAQSVVSRFLQVSSFFDDEAENLSGSDQESSNYNSSSKVVQTWSNQYYRNKPVVVLAKENSVIDEQRGISSNFLEKPLLLPVRSLKSRVLDVDSEQSGVDSGSLSRSSSNLGSRRNSSKGGNGEPGPGGVDYVNLGEKSNESVVLHSPVPWRSRSGRMEVKEDFDSLSMEESEFHRGFRRSSSRSSSENSSPKLSPSPSLSRETPAKSSADFAKKKSFYRSSVPPPPPPPPPMVRRSSSMKPGPTLSEDEEALEKVLQRSLTSGRKEFGNQERPPREYADSFGLGKSMRTTRASNGVWMDKTIDDVPIGKPEKNYTGRKLMGLDKTERINPKSLGFTPKQAFTEYEEKQNDEKVLVETEDEDSESDDDDIIVKKSSVSGSVNSEGGRDVDKKADEFIAKFREQIRLQRIDSIKKSTANISRHTSSYI